MRFRLIEEIDKSTLNQAVKHAEGFKHSLIDLDSRKIVIPLYPNSSEEELMSDGMLGDWYENNGFTVSFERGDFEYTTQDKWRNRRGWNREKGHKAYLRNRLIMTVTW